MSEKYKPLRFDGVSRADSLTWNPHKLLGTLLQCSTFHLKEKVLTSDEFELSRAELGHLNFRAETELTFMYINRKQLFTTC